MRLFEWPDTRRRGWRSSYGSKMAPKHESWRHWLSCEAFLYDTDCLLASNMSCGCSFLDVCMLSSAPISLTSVWQLSVPKSFYPHPLLECFCLASFIAGLQFYIKTCLFLYPRHGDVLWFVINSAGYATTLRLASLLCCIRDSNETSLMFKIKTWRTTRLHFLCVAISLGSFH